MESQAPDIEQKLHPYSFGFEVISSGRRFLVPAAFALFGAASGNQVGMVIAACLFTLQIAIAGFRHATFRYQIHDHELVIRKGWLFRSVRRIPLFKIQNVDLLQNPLHRWAKVAEVKIETASGSEPEAVLRVLSMEQVALLRRGIFGNPGTSVEPTTESTLTGHVLPATEATPRDEGLLVHTIPTRNLVLAGLCSNHGLVLVSVVIGTLYELNAVAGRRFRWQSWGSVFDWHASTWILWALGIVAAGLVVVRLFSAVWFVLRFYGYEMRLVGKDIRIECGLLTKVAATIPVDRIQLVSIQNGWLLRKLGFATIHVETAGGVGADDENAKNQIGRKWFVPVIATGSVAKVLTQIKPDCDWNDDHYPWTGLSPHAPARLMKNSILLEVLLLVAGTILWFPWGGLVSLAFFPFLLWRAHKKARSSRYFRYGTLVGYRSGTWTKKLSITFLPRVQTVRWTQSPLDRYWKMAGLEFDTASSGIAEHAMHIPMLDETFSEQERQHLTSLLFSRTEPSSAKAANDMAQAR